MAKAKNNTQELLDPLANDAAGDAGDPPAIDYAKAVETLGDPLGDEDKKVSSVIELNDQGSFDDEEAFFGRSDLPSDRYVIAWISSVDNYPSNVIPIKVNGVKAEFVIGRAVSVPYYYVEAARASGRMSFQNSQDPKAGKALKPNHPLVNVTEICQDKFFIKRDEAMAYIEKHINPKRPQKPVLCGLVD